jgi:hypothetical protein
MTIARNIIKYIFVILNFFEKTATSLGNMKKTDSNFRSHSVYKVLTRELKRPSFQHSQDPISTSW